MSAPRRSPRSSAGTSSATCSPLVLQDVRVFCERVGGGFGGKQEVLTEDLTALAAMKTGRPVQWEFTREEQFVASTYRHPMQTTVKLGAEARRHADRHPAPHRLQHRRLWQPRRRDPLPRLQRIGRGLPLPEQEDRRLRGVHQHGAVGRLPRLRADADDLRRRVAMDELARALGMDPFELRQRNVVEPGDAMISLGEEAERRRDRQLRAGPVPRHRARRPGARERRGAAPDGDDWLIGRGIALPCTTTAPPRSIAPRPASRCWKTEPTSWRSARRSSATAPPPQRADRRHARWARRSPGCTSSQSDTDRTGFDTGAFASTGTSSRARGSHLAAEALRERILEFAAQHTQVPPEMCRLDDDSVICGEVRLSLADLRAGGGGSRASAGALAQGVWIATQRRLQRARLPYRASIASPARSRSCRASTPRTRAR